MAALALSLVLLANLVGADQPVNCLRQQFHDQWWTFHVSRDSEFVDLFQIQEVCTHSLPNRVQILSSDHRFSFKNEDAWQVLIHADFSAEARFCKGGDLEHCNRERVMGRWMAYYDQALHVELDNGLRFLANFKYEIKRNVTRDPLKADFKKMARLVQEVDDQAKAQFDSICNATMVGFAQNVSRPGTLQKHPVTCFYGHKDFRQLYEDQVAPKGRQPKTTYS